MRLLIELVLLSANTRWQRDGVSPKSVIEQKELSIHTPYVKVVLGIPAFCIGSSRPMTSTSRFLRKDLVLHPVTTQIQIQGREL